ncbi:hypothetical protein CS062_14690 [Roseateles chitinivorans]|uniref:Uncharacterized protein n=1 Tax=Roseateles chitinivorans TaxID=2917965 RepID=A0A2G9CA41_9BURK|nr:hypothetical protein [Roseateles chitinivorans]PIM52399.1 hypothetical protein CS062_14690 [Roseateles chitinivorans]
MDGDALATPAAETAVSCAGTGVVGVSSAAARAALADSVAATAIYRHFEVEIIARFGARDEF